MSVFLQITPFPLGVAHHSCITFCRVRPSVKGKSLKSPWQSGCADCSQHSGISREMGRFFQHKPAYVTCCSLGMKWHDLSISGERSAGWTMAPGCSKATSTGWHAQSSLGAPPCQGKVGPGCWGDKNLASICIIYQGLWQKNTSQKLWFWCMDSLANSFPFAFGKSA